MNLRGEIVLCIVCLAGCEEPFAPKGPFKEKLIVYAILENRTDTQYVRVFKTYNPTGFDPLESVTDQAVRGAEVTVSQGNSVIRYQEGVTTRADTSRYKDHIVVYSARPFRVQPGSSYDLTVVSQQLGSVRSSVTVPARGRVEVANVYVFYGQGSEKEDIVVNGYVRNATRGFMIRFFVDYEYPQGDSWFRGLEEIPSRVRVFEKKVKVYSYPLLTPRVSGPTPEESVGLEMVVFSREAYKEKLEDLWALHPYFRIVGLLFVMTQVEPSLYSYYNMVNGFQDQYSIRQDLPDWSNIPGGYGVFGAMVEDSVYVTLR